MLVENKVIYENILTLTKSLVTLYLNATVESSNEGVRNVFNNGLIETLEMQDEIYQNMKDDGMYTIENVSSSAIKKIYKKLTKDEA